MTYSTGNAFTGTFEHLPFTLVALLPADGHLVLTHISSGDWHAIELAIASAVGPGAGIPQYSSGASS
jgi:hypothetical protein